MPCRLLSTKIPTVQGRKVTSTAGISHHVTELKEAELAML
jgi:hypothetical protein